jgi:hypothetical protein
MFIFILKIELLAFAHKEEITHWLLGVKFGHKILNWTLT